MASRESYLPWRVVKNSWRDGSSAPPETGWLGSSVFSVFSSQRHRTMHSKSSCPFSYSMCMVIVVEPGAAAVTRPVVSSTDATEGSAEVKELA